VYSSTICCTLPQVWSATNRCCCLCCCCALCCCLGSTGTAKAPAIGVGGLSMGAAQYCRELQLPSLLLLFTPLLLAVCCLPASCELPAAVLMHCQRLLQLLTPLLLPTQSLPAVCQLICACQLPLAMACCL
jgi:hypothetical protein